MPVKASKNARLHTDKGLNNIIIRSSIAILGNGIMQKKHGEFFDAHKTSPK